MIVDDSNKKNDEELSFETNMKLLQTFVFCSILKNRYDRRRIKFL